MKCKLSEQEKTKHHLFTSQKRDIFIVSLGSLSNNGSDGYENIT